MKNLRIWPAEFVFTDVAGTTQADFHLQAEGRDYHGRGQASLPPIDGEGPSVGEQLAAARAISDVARQILGQVDGVVRDPEEMTVEEFRTALGRHVSTRGEVFPSGLGLIQAGCHPTGRVWDVAREIMADQEQMRYLAGGNRLDEVADTVARWAGSTLSLEQIRMVIAAGGYDPDPFEPLALAGMLQQVLQDGDATRVIHGERAGSWISDQMALASATEVVPKVLEAIS